MGKKFFFKFLKFYRSVIFCIILCQESWTQTSIFEYLKALIEQAYLWKQEVGQMHFWIFKKYYNNVFVEVSQGFAKAICFKLYASSKNKRCFDTNNFLTKSEDKLRYYEARMVWKITHKNSKSMEQVAIKILFVII